MEIATQWPSPAGDGRSDGCDLTQAGRTTTGEQVASAVSLEGRRAIVTGASSGLGAETARCLALAGAEVTLAVRSREAGRSVAEQVVASTGNKRIEVRHLDVADMRSVRRFSESWTGPLHILVNNAGVMALPDLQLSAQGVELQLATNALGPCALTAALRHSLAEAGGARVVSVSSAAHRASRLEIDDVAFARTSYDKWVAYGRSKTGAALLAVWAAEIFADDGVIANSLHPGAIWTSLQRYTGAMRTPPHLRKSVEQGAATSVYLAAAVAAGAWSGRYFEDCRPSPVLQVLPEYHAPGVMEWAADRQVAERMWSFATEIAASV